MKFMMKNLRNILLTLILAALGCTDLVAMKRIRSNHGDQPPKRQRVTTNQVAEKCVTILCSNHETIENVLCTVVCLARELRAKIDALGGIKNIENNSQISVLNFSKEIMQSLIDYMTAIQKMLSGNMLKQDIIDELIVTFYQDDQLDHNKIHALHNAAKLLKCRPLYDALASFINVTQTVFFNPPQNDYDYSLPNFPAPNTISYPPCNIINPVIEQALLHQSQFYTMIQQSTDFYAMPIQALSNSNPPIELPPQEDDFFPDSFLDALDTLLVFDTEKSNDQEIKSPQIIIPDSKQEPNENNHYQTDSNLIKLQDDEIDYLLITQDILDAFTDNPLNQPEPLHLPVIFQQTEVQEADPNHDDVPLICQENKSAEIAQECIPEIETPHHSIHKYIKITGELLLKNQPHEIIINQLVLSFIDDNLQENDLKNLHTQAKSLGCTILSQAFEVAQAMIHQNHDHNEETQESKNYHEMDESSSDSDSDTVPYPVLDNLPLMAITANVAAVLDENIPYATVSIQDAIPLNDFDNPIETIVTDSKEKAQKKKSRKSKKVESLSSDDDSDDSFVPEKKSKPTKKSTDKKKKSVNSKTSSSDTKKRPKRTRKDKDKSFKCDFEGCYYSTSYKNDLKVHKRIHTGEKPFICDVCNKGFTTSGARKVHIRKHTGERPYTCDVCNKGFINSSALAEHKITHTDAKPHICDVCKKGFTDRSALTKHKRIHSGERPYKCTYKGCGKAFTQSCTLTAHTRIHTGEKPFVCTICDKGFANAGSLANHKKTHADKKP